MSKSFIKIIIVTIAIVIISSLLFRGSVVFNNFNEGKPVYLVKVANFDGNYETYFCSSYVIDDKCIKFIDEFGFEQLICQQFKVEKWK